MELYKNGITKQFREFERHFAEANKDIQALEREGWAVVMPFPKPTPATDLKRVIRNGVEIDANGNTVEAWIEVNMFTSDLLDEDGVTVLKTIAEQESDYLAKLETDAINTIRTTASNYVQGLIDTEAQSLGFDNINSIAKFIGFVNPYEADAISLRNWCALMWETTETTTATTIEELLLELPTRV